MPAENYDPLRNTLQKEAHRSLRRAVATLGEPHRTAVLLFYWMESSIDEIAEVLDSRPATIRSYLFRARKRLRKRLEEAS